VTVIDDEHTGPFVDLLDRGLGFGGLTRCGRGVDELTIE
jgi:hypothetical protein